MQQRWADNADWSDNRGEGEEPISWPRLRAVGKLIVGSAGPKPYSAASPAAAPPDPPPATRLAAAPSGSACTRFAHEVCRLLGGLGVSRGSVAASLETMGVRAAPDDPAGSPVALYLGAVVGADPNVKSVRIGADSVIVCFRAWWRPEVRVPLPEVVRDFTVAFDARCYPSLLRGKVENHRTGPRPRADSERTE
jgi:hypothetical protein